MEITARPCPLFVPLVEAGYVDHSALDKQQVTRLVIAQYLAEVREAGVDTLILGCTHYPFLKPLLRELVPEGVELIDTGAAVARQLERLLAERGLLAGGPAQPARFWSSGAPAALARVLPALWGAAAPVAALPV